MIPKNKNNRKWSIHDSIVDTSKLSFTICIKNLSTAKTRSISRVRSIESSIRSPTPTRENIIRAESARLQSHQLAFNRTTKIVVVSRRCRLSGLLGFHTTINSIKDGCWMRDGVLRFRAGSPWPWRADSALFARLAYVGKSGGNQVASPADLPTNVS